MVPDLDGAVLTGGRHPAAVIAVGARRGHQFPPLLRLGLDAGLVLFSLCVHIPQPNCAANKNQQQHYYMYLLVLSNTIYNTFTTRNDF